MIFHIIWAVLISALSAFSAWQYFDFQDTRTSLVATIEQQSTEMVELEQKNIERISNIQTLFREYQSGSTNLTKALEKELASQELDFQEKIAEIERKKEISEKLLANTNEDLVSNIESLTEKIFDLESNSKTDIISKWDDIIVRLECNYLEAERSFGSGVYFGSNSPIDFGAGNSQVILTNSHVIEEDLETPTDCTITFNSGEEIMVTQSKEEDSIFSFFESFDAGFISLGASSTPQILPDPSIEYNLCNIRPQNGDEIITLGYPRIGSQEGITTTEGIISGYDEEFFITSAKIGQGNSGGAGISVKNDCYFGIPTLVKKDEVESLGRILDITKIFE